MTGFLDEVGWGAWAGPIVSCCAVFRPQDLQNLPPGVRDSKLCTAKQRYDLEEPIMLAAYAWGIGESWPYEIDQIGPGPALQLTYTRAIEMLDRDRMPTDLVVDGVRTVKSWTYPQRAEPRADQNYLGVSAASILAKVYRDRLMERLAESFPGYGWERNKGYGTPEHREGILIRGLLVDEQDRSRYLHRRRYCRSVAP